MRKASGYITEHGRFFVDAADAELNEAEVMLEEILQETTYTPQDFLDFVRVHAKEVKRYVNAIETAPRPIDKSK